LFDDALLQGIEVGGDFLPSVAAADLNDEGFYAEVGGFEPSGFLVDKEVESLLKGEVKYGEI
jgi:hypothetical protein